MKELRPLNQGTYGCIFRPGLTCSGEEDRRGRFVTKSQRKNKTSDNEAAIGRKIRNIVRFGQYFAPVVKSCVVTAEALQRSGVKLTKCRALDSRDREIDLSKVRDLGNYTLGLYLSEARKDKEELLSRMVDVHLYLLVALGLLADNNIVQYDLKDNNIMMDENQNPIIIDFGLSFDFSTLSAANEADIFYVHYSAYPPWCLDIVLLSHIVQENKQTQLCNRQEIEGLIREYFKKNPAIRLCGGAEVDRCRKACFAWAAGFEGRPLREMMTDLQSNWRGWDTFSLSAIFLQAAKVYRVTLPYEDLLRRSVLGVPGDRITAGEMRRAATRAIS